MVVLIGNNVFAQYFPVDTAKLNNAYRHLLEEPNNLEAHETYFKIFPGSWKEYEMTYQILPYDNYDSSMHSVAYKHLRAFGDKLTGIPDYPYCEKLVNIAIGMRLDTDVSRYYKDFLWEKMQTKMKYIFSYLDRLRKGHRMEFWEFYWSSTTENKDSLKEFNRLKELYEKKYPDEIEIMAVAYKYFHNGINLASDGYLK